MYKTNKKIKVSLIIPYKKRLHNINLVLSSLEEQTMDKDNFEVVVGCMEYSIDYVSMCVKFNNTLNIKTIMTNEDWQVAYARNLAIRQANGEILVLLDADIILDKNFLTNLYNNYFAYGQNQCIVGQMINYDNNTVEVENVEFRPFSFYKSKLEEISNYNNLIIDDRLKNPHNIPWAYAWTALIAIPSRLIMENNLYFDLNFKGYGVEDLEWAYRISKSRIPIVIKEDVWGVHLPHTRNLNNNRETEKINYDYFLKKWPGIDVELTCAFGDFKGNEKYIEFKKEINKITQNEDFYFSVIETIDNNESVLIVGVINTNNKKLCNDIKLKKIKKEYPIVGLSLPYNDNEISRCIILPSIYEFSDEYKDIILHECNRISKT